MSHTKSGCNTRARDKFKKKAGRNRARSWFLTLNNPTSDHLSQLSHEIFFEELDIIKYLVQEEEGKNGTKHLQGAVQFKNQVDFDVLKKMHPEAHWEKCISIISSLRYCGKLDTRAGKVFTMGDVEKYVEQPKVSIEDMMIQFRLKNIDYKIVQAAREGHLGHFNMIG